MLVRPHCTIQIWDLRWDLENLRSLCQGNWSMNCFLHLVCCCSIWRCTLCFVCVVLANVCHISCLVSVVRRIFCLLVILFFLLFSIVPMKIYTWKLMYYWENWCWLGVQFAQISMLYQRGNINVWFIIMSLKTSSKNVT